MEQPEATPAPEPAPGEPQRKSPARPRLVAKLDQPRGLRRFAGPLVVFGLLAAFGLLLWLRSLPPSWVEFKDPEGLFRVEFPEPPTQRTATTRSWSGAPVPVRTAAYGTQWEDEFYAVDATTYDRPVPKDLVEKLFDAVMQDFLASLEKIGPSYDKPQLEKSGPWSLDADPGRESQVSIHRGAGLLVVRLLLVNERKMVMLRTGVHEHHHGENDRRFLDSFRVLGR